jgi:catechol 2,3-dioxygenase
MKARTFAGGLRLIAAKVPFDGVSKALYLRGAEGNGIDLHHDRHEAEWPRHAQGHLAMDTGVRDIDALLREAA